MREFEDNEQHPSRDQVREFAEFSYNSNDLGNRLEIPGHLMDIVRHQSSCLQCFDRFIKSVREVMEEREGSIPLPNIKEVWSIDRLPTPDDDFYRLYLEKIPHLNISVGLAAAVILLNSAGTNWLRGNFLDAEKEINGAVERAKKVADKKSEAIAHLCKGIMRRSQGDYTEAEKSLEASFLSYSLLEDPEDEVSIVYHSLGETFRLKGNYEKAEAYFGQSLDIARSWHEPLGETIVLFSQGMSLYDQTFYPRAMEKFQEAREVAPVNEGRVEKLFIESYLEAALCQVDRQRPLRDLRSRILDAKLAAGFEWSARLGLLHTDVYFRRGNHERAAELACDVLPIAHRFGFMGIAADANAYLALSLNQIGEPERAQVALNQARWIYGDQGVRTPLASSLRNL